MARRPSRKPLDKDLYADVVAEAKSRFDVWPSAYASGWVVKTYKARGGRYAGGDRKTRSGLTKWFGESWVDLSRPIHDEDGELVGYEPCGRKTAQDASNDPAAYPKCRPLAEAMRMSPAEVEDAIKRKRAAEAKAGRGGRGGRGARAPVRVSTYRTNPANTVFDWELPGTRGIREVTVDDVTILYGYNGESAHIASVRTKIKAQGQGKARRVLELFCAEADALGIPIKLEASPLTKKVNRARLVAFYESLGFEKTGRTINPAGDPEMVRLPARANPDVTSTQAFRRWFGDSKVVDAAGEPLVVYHGTDKSFDVFKSTTKEAFYGKGGMYFSNVREAAQTFAPSVENVMPVYLALQNPYFDDGEDAGVTIAKIKRRGFDGIVREADFVDEDGDVQDHTIYVAFYPEQIKLADGTNTTFDPKSPDVRFNPRPDGEAIAAWCASDESYAVLDETASAGSSWMAGACVLLAKAIRKRHPEARLVGIETDGVIQHVGARIGDTVYDALGEHDPHAWARDWLAYEQLPARTLVRVVSLKGTPRSALPDAESPATPADVALVARALP